MVDYTASLKKPFLDIKNLLIGVLLSIFPIIQWFSLGYALECTGLTKRKVPLNKSPNWTDWGKLFANGFLTVAISIIYFLPALVIFLIGFASVLAAILRVVNFTDFITGNQAAISQAISQNVASIMPNLVFAVPFLVIAVLFVVLAAYVVQSAILNFLAYNSFGKAFAFGEVFRRAFTGKYFVAWILVCLISLVAILIFNWIPWVGPAVMYFTANVISYTIFGQVYKELPLKKSK
ncbi:MAG: DUF4013 domain-containing protein [archaeon]